MIPNDFDEIDVEEQDVCTFGAINTLQPLYRDDTAVDLAECQVCSAVVIDSLVALKRHAQYHGMILKP